MEPSFQKRSNAFHVIPLFPQRGVANSHAGKATGCEREGGGREEAEEVDARRAGSREHELRNEPVHERLLEDALERAKQTHLDLLRTLMKFVITYDYLRFVTY